MMRTLRALWSLAIAGALALTGACVAGEDGQGTTESAAKKPGGGGGGGTGGDPGAGSCQDILDHGCDGLTGDKLEGCKADIKNAFDACVKVKACVAERDAILKQCAPKDTACIGKADQAFSDCIGPSPNTQPGK
jgi:hypothetical protein